MAPRLGRNGAGKPNASSTHATFRVPCANGDKVWIASTVAEFRRSSFDVRHRLLHEGGTLAVEGSETRVWFGPASGGEAVVCRGPTDPDC
ncbi:hotdog family protein [Roseicella aquatilis]|uniref:hypothetical protein n=1 Tax=Roseicella aquatilis TaxID=2527868 RepID=UPI00351A9457